MIEYYDSDIKSLSVSFEILRYLNVLVINFRCSSLPQAAVAHQLTR